MSLFDGTGPTGPPIAHIPVDDAKVLRQEPMSILRDSHGRLLAEVTILDTLLAQHARHRTVMLRAQLEDQCSLVIGCINYHLELIGKIGDEPA